MMTGKYDAIKSIVDRFNALAVTLSYAGQYSPPVHLIADVVRLKPWITRISNYDETYYYKDFLQFFDCKLDAFVTWFIEPASGNYWTDSEGKKIPEFNWINLLQFYSDSAIVRIDSRAIFEISSIVYSNTTCALGAWNSATYYYGFYHYFVSYNNKFYRNKFTTLLLTGNLNKNPETETDYWIEIPSYLCSVQFARQWFKQIDDVLTYCENY
jgi:hypothetical protein